MAKDGQLRKMADRLQARAIRRCEELPKQIDARKKQFRCHYFSNLGSRASGFSERQRVTAVRVAAVTAQKFEQQIESGKSPTVTQLAWRGDAPVECRDGPQDEYPAISQR